MERSRMSARKDYRHQLRLALSRFLPAPLCVPSMFGNLEVQVLRPT